VLSTRQLRYFVEIAECGSFSAAAERLFIAQSALSRQIKDMETRLQTPLFERTARQPRLTAAGEALLPRARNLLNELSKASAMATEVGTGQRGTLRLSHSSTVSISGHLLRRISTYLDQQPGVSLDLGKLSSEAQLEELAEGRLDVGLLRLPVLRQREGIQVAPVFTERLLLAVPNDHRLADSASVELVQLRDEAFISIPHPQRGGLSYLCADLCMRQGFFPKAARVMSRKTTQLQLIQAGFGIALLPESMQEIAPPGVRFLPLTDADCQSTVALAYRQNPTPLIHHFIQAFSNPPCGSEPARECGLSATEDVDG
jgi:DNA-binding transcriptional LysR family regulator